MSENQPVWMNWARTLQQWGINKGVAYLLEATGSLNILPAQLVYIGQPMLSSTFSSRSIEAFAKILENPAERRKFIDFLMEKSACEPVAEPDQ